MSRKNHAAAEAGEHEERIEVNLDAKDGEQITRRPARGSVTTTRRSAEADRIGEWEQKSRKVQKRLVQQARTFNQQIADIQAENQRQLALRDDRISKLERGGDNTSTDDVAHAKVMDQFEEAIAAAQEEGDSRKVAKLTREMTQADNKFWAAKTAKATGGSGGKGNEEAGKGAGNGTVAQPKTLVPTKAGVAWAKANAEWFEDPTDRTHVAARAMANALYKDKTDDGDDRDDPEFYEEIRREVAKRYPEIETVSTLRGRAADPDDDGDEDDDDEDDDADARPNARERERETKPARRAASLSLPNRGDPKHNRANRLATITSAEQRTMRAVGLDPDKNKDVMAFLNSRNEMDASA